MKTWNKNVTDLIDKNTFGSKTALFHTFGCKLNFAETSTVARIFASKGIQRVHEGDVPDYVVINSCSVTDIADKMPSGNPIIRASLS